MRNNISSFLLSLAFFCVTTIEVYTVQIENVIEQSKLFRIIPENSPEQEAIRRTEILNSATASIKHFGIHENVKELVTAFLKDHFHQESLDYLIIDSSETSTHGRSDDPVFFIIDQNGDMPFVVKAFQHPKQLKGNFLAEISGLDHLLHLQLQHALPIYPLASGIGESKEIEYGLLLETAAKGIRVDSYFKFLAKEDLSAEEREHFLNLIKNGMKAFGKGLAELHATKSLELGKLHESLFKKFKKKVSDVLQNEFISASLSEKIDLASFQSYLASIEANAREITFFHTFQHGSSHLGNLLYNQDLDKITFIDVAKLTDSVSFYNQPIAESVFDIMRTEEHVIKNLSEILPEEEINELIAIFYAAYNEEAGAEFDHQLLQFHKTWKKLRRLVKFCNYDEIADPKQKAHAKATFEEAIHYFELIKQ